MKMERKLILNITKASGPKSCGRFGPRDFAASRSYLLNRSHCAVDVEPGGGREVKDLQNGQVQSRRVVLVA
jgi:hypothetical protein